MKSVPSCSSRQPAACCCPRPPDFIAKLTAINDDYVRFGKAGDLDSAAIANDNFHQMIFSGCRNRQLADLIQQYWIEDGSDSLLCHCESWRLPNSPARNITASSRP